LNGEISCVIQSTEPGGLIQQFLTDFSDSGHGIQALWANPDAIADAAAAKQTERIFQPCQPLGTGLVAAVTDEAPGLHNHSSNH